MTRRSADFTPGDSVLKIMLALYPDAGRRVCAQALVNGYVVPRDLWPGWRLRKGARLEVRELPPNL